MLKRWCRECPTDTRSRKVLLGFESLCRRAQQHLARCLAVSAVYPPYPRRFTVTSKLIKCSMHLSASSVIIDAADDDAQTPVVAVRVFEMFLRIETLAREVCFNSPCRCNPLCKGLGFESPDLCKTEIASRNVIGFDYIWIDDQQFCRFVGPSDFAVRSTHAAGRISVVAGRVSQVAGRVSQVAGRISNVAVRGSHVAVWSS